MKKLLTCIVFLAFSTNSFAQKKDYLVNLKTSKGDIAIILYDETPLHKKSFVKLVKKKFYNDLLFHRVIENFMIQGGDPNSKNAEKGARLGSGGDNLERIPFEYNETRFHKKGVLAAARDNNPEKKSSACQFYLVQGKIQSDADLEKAQQRTGAKYTAEQLETYKSLGGTPHLDKNYTVFGEAIKGLDVIDAIAKVEKDKFDRPIEDQKMKMTVKKMSKKKITKLYGYKF